MASPNDLVYRAKTVAKDWAGRAGIDIRIRREPLRFLQRHNIRSVLDIGANYGQFAKHVRSILPAARIYSFEPLPLPFAALQTAMAGDTNFEPYAIALGSHEGTAEFEENEFSAASSLLTVSERSIQAWPETARTRRTSVPVRTLDSWASEHPIETPCLVKLDVQGYEDQVIAHGQKTISEAAVVICEVSFAQIYKDQPLFDSINSQLRELGFCLHGMIDNNCEQATGEILSADAVYLRDAGAAGQDS